MQKILKTIGRIGLLVTILPALFFMMEWISLDVTKAFMIIGTVVWLVTAPVVQKLNKETA